MVRTLAAIAIAFLPVAAALPAAAESATIRIEPRPYYGSIVTIEQRVRVWRPLPPTRYVIINPEGRTPLSLRLSDSRQHSTSHNHVHGDASGAAASRAGNTFATPLGAVGSGYGARPMHGKRGDGHRSGGFRPRQFR